MAEKRDFEEVGIHIQSMTTQALLLFSPSFALVFLVPLCLAPFCYILLGFALFRLVLFGFARYILFCSVLLRLVLHCSILLRFALLCLDQTCFDSMCLALFRIVPRLAARKHTHIYIYIHIFVYIYVYIHIHISESSEAFLGFFCSFNSVVRYAESHDKYMNGCTTHASRNGYMRVPGFRIVQK